MVVEIGGSLIKTGKLCNVHSKVVWGKTIIRTNEYKQIQLCNSNKNNNIMLQINVSASNQLLQ